MSPTPKAKRTVVNLLDINICEMRCQCGWNISIGSNSYDLLDGIMAYLSSKAYIKDMTNNPPHMADSYDNFDEMDEAEPDPETFKEFVDEAQEWYSYDPDA